jgi:hypothetical protein
MTAPGFVAHRGRFLDVDGLVVEFVQGESISPPGDVINQDPIAVLVEDAGYRELTPALADQLADVLARAAAIADGAQ